MLEATSAAALFRYCVRRIEHIQNPLSRHPSSHSAPCEVSGFIEKGV
jgi:hypothetical protein